MNSLETFLEKAERRFDAIETHEEGYNWANDHGPELMGRLAAAERVIESGKLLKAAIYKNDPECSYQDTVKNYSALYNFTAALEAYYKAVMP